MSHRTTLAAHCIVLACSLLCCTLLHADMSRQAYIAKYAHLAVAEMRRTGIPASITLAQAILESDSGNSELARISNNHFGIKCKAEWTGRTVRYDDDAPDECFRRYSSVRDSYRDHSEFLCNRDRYASLFQLSPYDYKGWAQGLKAAGYATSPTYATNLIRIIEEHKLTRYDQLRPAGSTVAPAQVQNTSSRTSSAATVRASAATKAASAAAAAVPATAGTAILPATAAAATASAQAVVPAGPSSSQAAAAAADAGVQTYRRASFGRVKPGQMSLQDALAYPDSYLIILERKIWKNNGVKCVLARENDTFQSIASDLGCGAGRLRRFNEVDRDYVPQQGEIVYIKKKRVMYERSHVTHVVASGESMRSIAQDYGLRTGILYRNNNLTPHSLLSVGQVLIIQP